MNKLRNYLAVLAVLAGIAWVGTSIYQRNNDIGASVVSRYKTTLASSMTSNQTTVPVSSITTFDGHVLTMADVGSRVFLTIEPGSVREEIVSCTAITSSQWSSCTRGLAFYGTSTVAVSSNQKAHNAGATVVMSNVHYVYEDLVDKDSNETIGGQKIYTDLVTFGTIPFMPTTTPTSSSQVASKMYVDNVIAAGAPDGTESVKGLFEAATQAEMISGALTGGTGANLVLQPRYVTSTRSGTGTYLVLTAPSGYVSSTLGGVAFSMATLNSSALVVQNPASASILAATSSIPITSATTSTLDRSWVPFMFGGDGTDGVLNVSSGTTTIDLNNEQYVVKQYSSITIATTTFLAFSNPTSTGAIVVLKSKGACDISGTIYAKGIGALGGDNGGEAGNDGLGVLTMSDGGAGGEDNGGDATGSGGAASTAQLFLLNNAGNIIRVTPGAGGGGGGNGFAGAGGDGGRGGGAIIIECGGSVSFTGVINVSGDNGTTGGNSGSGGGAGGGGGGAGGILAFIYNSLTVNTGTVTKNGGNGGNGGDGGGNQGTAIGNSGGGGGAGAGNRYASGAGGGEETSGANGSGTGGGTGGTAGASPDSGEAGSGGGGGAAGDSYISKNYEF